MKIGIVGLPQSGKKTLFELLTRSEIDSSRKDDLKAIPGNAHIRDTRFEVLAKLYDPQKRTPAQIELMLLPDLDKRLIQEGVVFQDIANLDALCLVIRAFEEDAVYHVDGSVDPDRDIAFFTEEFILHDLLFIEKRLERIAVNETKGKAKQYADEKQVLERLQAHLEQDLPLRSCELSEEEQRIIKCFPFITLKELVIALNQSEDTVADTTLADRFNGRYRAHRLTIMAISAKLEAEIATLDSEEETSAFMEALSIKEPAVIRLSRHCIEALSLVSFFTVGKDEVKQWLIPRGAAAPQAGRVIHSDIERGFIRAEVMKHDELIELGTEQNLKRAGKYYVMGKDYCVEDGDIVNFLFNV